MRPSSLSKSAMLTENLELRARLEEAEEMLRAISHGEADALVIESGAGPSNPTMRARSSGAGSASS